MKKWLKTFMADMRFLARKTRRQCKVLIKADHRKMLANVAVSLGTDDSMKDMVDHSGYISPNKLRTRNLYNPASIYYAFNHRRNSR